MQAIKHRYPIYENNIFIAVTAYAMSGDKDRLLDAGFTDYIPKPIDKENLTQTIKHNWLKNYLIILTNTPHFITFVN